jgi:hypothetical protein
MALVCGQFGAVDADVNVKSRLVAFGRVSNSDLASDFDFHRSAFYKSPKILKIIT